MTAGRRYLVGVTVVAAAALLLSFVLPPAECSGVRLALVLAVSVQGPLGWWLVRATGTQRFLVVWAAGIAVRLAVVAACALLVAPRLGLSLTPTLFALVALLMCFVVVEVIVVGEAGRRGTEVR